MNYKLSTYADRVKGKRGFLLIKGGAVTASKVSKFEGDNIKENALEVIVQGITVVRNEIAHEDLLIIEVQNSHLCNWLSGSVEYREYSVGLDKVFAQLDTVDCRYRFVYESKPLAKGYVADNEPTKMDTVGLDDLMSEFGEGEE